MRHSFKIILAIITALTVWTSLPAEPQETQHKTFQADLDITLSARPIAALSNLSPYKTMETFVSEPQNPGFKFTSVGGFWEETKPNGTHLEAEVRFKVKNKWTEWLALEEEVDPLDSKIKYATASTNPATEMQYRFYLYGDGINLPIAKNPSWTFIHAAESVHAKPTPKPKYSASQSVVNYVAAANTKVISRSEWGADESYRYLDDDAEVVLIESDEDTADYEAFIDELAYSRVVEGDKEGDYVWPLQYSDNVKKFIIHHTATTNDVKTRKQVEQALRDIYFFHAVTRGWGDIGYNYMIDRNGLIWEGRAGGEGVKGAHSGLWNNGSIGIAVLGNYETSEVPEKVVPALSALIAEKSKIHGINPEGYSNFRGEVAPNIVGHRDVMNTTCPGTHLYSKLPILRSSAYNKTQNTKKKFVKDYDYQDLSELYFLEMKPEEIVEVTIKMENIGKVDWNDETFIVVNKNPDVEAALFFPTRKGSNLASMQEDLVKPGDTATFKFRIQSSKESNIVEMDIAPIINGNKKISDYINLPVSIQQADYKYEYVDSKYPDHTMKPGEKFEGWVKLKNTGNVPWQSNSHNSVVLGTDHERDRLTDFIQPPTSRIASLEENTVKPGEIGTFNLTLKAPVEAGKYKEYFTPVVEGETWMLDSGLHFETTVISDKNYTSEIVGKTDHESLKQGKSYSYSLKLLNLGQKTWNKDDLKVTFIKEDKNFKVKNVKLTSNSVKPGDIANITFTVQVKDGANLGTDSIILIPKVKNNKVQPKPVYFREKIVTSKNTQPTFWEMHEIDPNQFGQEVQEGDSDEKDIRIKLGFEGNPQITADSKYYLYVGNKKVDTLSKGDSVIVKKSNNKILVIADGENIEYSQSKVIRLVPKSDDTLMEIVNFDNRPAWNPKLNDNIFYGALEVRMDDGKLIVINELPVETYLTGLGEVSNSELPEKIKAIMVAARSYAIYYIEEDQKFPGKPYHLDADPEVSQKYLGGGLTLRSPNVKKGVKDTRGVVMTYKDTIIKTPYFNQSDGGKTKSAKDVWGWTHTPYLISVSDAFCKADYFAGHGVGLSGCGAKGMAELGYGYVDILTHYYPGAKVTDLY